MTAHTAQFEDLRGRLFALSYRALGSRADAEDVVQEAFLRWQRVDPSEVRSPQSYLMTVVARLALDQLKSARRKREEYFGVWLPEPLLEPPDKAGHSPEEQAAAAESLSLAFLFVLESLTPAERVAFLLRDVFDYEYGSVAEALGTSEANARQLVSRARKHIRDRRPTAGPHAAATDPGRHRNLLEAFLAACASNDVGSLLGLLREDAVTYSDGGGKAAAALNPIVGADRVARFFLGLARKAPANLAWRIENVGGVPSLLSLEDDALTTLISFDLDADGKIAWILVQRNPDKLLRLV